MAGGRASDPPASLRTLWLQTTRLLAAVNKSGTRDRLDQPVKPAGREALGRSRGGLTTKIHLAVDGHGRPLALLVTLASAMRAPSFSPCWTPSPSHDLAGVAVHASARTT